MRTEYICPICGYSRLRENPMISYEICACCGYEFGTMMYWIDNEVYDLGNGEENEIVYKKVRDLWLAHGCPWFRKELRPKNWNLDSQLHNIKG